MQKKKSIKIAKRYLLTYKNTAAKIGRIKQEIQEAKDEAICIGGFDYSKDRIISSPKPDAPYVNWISRIDLKEEQLRKTERSAELLKNLLINKIAVIQDEQSRDILTKLYIELKEWNDIFEHGEQTERTYYNWHRKALEEFYEVIRENGK